MVTVPVFCRVMKLNGSNNIANICIGSKNTVSDHANVGGSSIDFQKDPYSSGLNFKISLKQFHI